jgi:dTDP-4-dehydrorhamnose reductase
MRVLVLGSSGMAGSVVATHLAEQGYDVTRVAGSRKVTDDTILLDLADERLAYGYLSEHEFDVVINCVGILLGDCERDAARAIYLNAYLPKHLERHFRGSRTKVIHLSTDCVFSGQDGPYREDSPYDGMLLYDRSKALGEIKNDKDLTLRMSIIGPELKAGSGLFHWFMQQ